MKNKKRAFTLAELIVVIVILAILSSISILIYMGYAESSRDSARISDIANIHKLLELYKIQEGTLPIPTNGVAVTYSGAVVWVQGTFGDTILDKVKNGGVELIDPATKTEYSYSLLNTLNDYQIGTVMESENSKASLLGQSKETTYAYLDGNFNGIGARTFTGGINYVFALPSITAAYLGENADLIDIVNNNGLVYNGYSNLPYSYNGTKFNILGGYDNIIGIDNSKLSIYVTNDLGVLTKITEESDNERIDLLGNVQNSYSGTVVSSTKPLVSVYSVSVEEPTNATKEVAINVVNKLLGSTISTNMSSFALLPFDGGGVYNTGGTSSGGSSGGTSSGGTPSPYTITFSESDGQTYLCSSCF
ncbi:MAG: prepilin-type N-terminal cleavage/methylation domain-containing protein [Candidatus Gracilibacteria bacterium]|nr:prepilin-type N-terminal cleavage/methylation domain-containing protein [Candidatus Gracilibacteria bacterium]